MNEITKPELTALSMPRHAPPPMVLTPQTFEQLCTFAELAAQSGLVPKSYENKPGAIMIAVQMGAELGLTPMQSIQSIAVINGRPGVWGDGLIGLCRGSPLCQDIVETMEGEGDALTAVCVATRRGATPVTARFGVADAKKAGLWGKDIWAKYPTRMLQNRARGFALRDAFPDVLRGLKTVEELLDTPRDDYRGTTIDAKPEPKWTRYEPRDANGNPNPPPPKTNTQQPPRQTARQWLDALRVELAAASSQDEVVQIAGRDDVKRMHDFLKGSALDELQAVLADAFGRTEGEPSDSAEDGADGSLDGAVPDFPGDRP